MKVAILTPTFSPFSGIDRLVEQEAESHAKKGNKVTIFCLRADMKSDYASVIELGMPKSPFFERIYRLFFFFDVFKISKCVKMLKGYDVVISHLYPMNLIAQKAKEKYGLKYVYYNAGVAYPHLFRSFPQRTYMRLFNYFSNRSIKGADSAISISNFLRSELKRETGIDSVVRYIEIDKKRFEKKNSQVVRKKFKLGDSPLLLYVGRISPHKGVHVLLQAFGKVRQELDSAKLIIVGKHTFGAYSRELKKLAGPNVIFAGFVPDNDLPLYYAACDVYVTCSLWEGFDIPIVEAEYAGKPSVAFDVGAHREVLRKGRLVRENDIDAFKDAVVALLKRKK